jgi:hypothetical protein
MIRRRIVDSEDAISNDGDDGDGESDINMALIVINVARRVVTR